MRRVLLTEEAANEVMRIRENDLGAYSDEKCNIADAYATLNCLINLGRDCEEIANCIEDLLAIMYVLERYNRLMNILFGSTENKKGRYEYVAGKELNISRDTPLNSIQCGLLEKVFKKHPDIKKIYAPVNIDAITIVEAAEILGCSVDELHKELQEEFLEERRSK